MGPSVVMKSCTPDACQRMPYSLARALVRQRLVFVSIYRKNEKGDWIRIWPAERDPEPPQKRYGGFYRLDPETKEFVFGDPEPARPVLSYDVFEDESRARVEALKQQADAIVQAAVASRVICGARLGTGGRTCSSRAGYVYVIQDIHSGLFKIGRTANIKNRMKALGVGKTARLVNHKYVPNAAAVEKAAHRRYRDQRLPQTEYFRLNSPPSI